MIKEIIVCDHEGCDQVRGETNHWFTLVTADYPPQFVMQKGVCRQGKQFCGQKHALAAFQQWMDTEDK